MVNRSTRGQKVLCDRCVLSVLCCLLSVPVPTKRDYETLKSDVFIGGVVVFCIVVSCVGVL